MTRAGRSAAREALRSSLLVADYERRLAEERARARRFEVAAASERRVAAALRAMDALGWRLLEDRRWPGTRHANVDLLLVGPGGVLVVDVKAWAEPRVEGGRLCRGDDDAAGAEALDTLDRLTELVEDSTTELGLAPLEVLPVVVLAGPSGATLPPVRLGRVTVVGEHAVVPWAAGRGRRLAEAQIVTVCERLASVFPAYDDATPLRAPVLLPEPVLPLDEGAAGVLFDADALARAELEAAARQPIEAWMAWLHPAQARAVRRAWNGPARVRGPAGTGKTVVGLHRAAYLAQSRPGPVLYTSFVRTLPAVLGELYRRLSPETCDRVEFVGLHAWALRLLRQRGVRCRLEPARATTLFNRAWLAAGRRTPLHDLVPDPDYWRAEIDHVIKGRALTAFEDYATLTRVGRRTALQPAHRRLVWRLYAHYDGLLRADGVHDFNDVLLLALREVRERPVEPAYSAVVVDEVQDLNRTGVQLLHALVGDRPDGLLLIGDGQQAVYPGGFTLAEAGVSVTGRSVVLRTNYRNAAAILDRAAQVVSGDAYDDLDGRDENGRREVAVARDGGLALRVDADGEAAHDAALLDAIGAAVRRGVRLGDMAVLTARRATAYRYLGVLARHGVAGVDLADYDGHACDAVKVGTFKRAKGLEFAWVFLPLLQDVGDAGGPGDAARDAAYGERTALARRELFVGMTRARDALWMGYLT